MATRISEETAARIAAAWPDLLDQFAAGEIMAPHFKRYGVTADQVRVWKVQDPARVADWDAAREQSADAYADMAAEIAHNPGADSRAARVSLQALMWLAAKRNPRQYSDKATLDVNVRTVDLTRIIQDANARLASARNPALADRAAAAVDAEILSPALKSLIG